MAEKKALLQRLEEIGQSLEKREGALALIGLGSVGTETGRIDEFSDLDFFVVVEPGFKQRFIDRQDWLEEIVPLAYRFQNCELGHKFLFEDGIYGEYAAFEPDELRGAVYRGGRTVWRRPALAHVDLSAGAVPPPSLRESDLDHAVGEALTNLYVGLGRYLRGEKLSAFLFVQRYPMDRLLSVLHLLEPEVDYYPDAFGNERRLERRYSRFAERVGGMLQGYERTPESALRVLDYLESIASINARMSREIRSLADRCLRNAGGSSGAKPYETR